MSKPSVVVIGGTGGIGHAIAKFYADQGCGVVITGRDAQRTAGIAAELGTNVRGIGLDVAEPETAEQALADIEHVDRLADRALEPGATARVVLPRESRQDEQHPEADPGQLSEAHHRSRPWSASMASS